MKFSHNFVTTYLSTASKQEGKVTLSYLRILGGYTAKVVDNFIATDWTQGFMIYSQHFRKADLIGPGQDLFRLRLHRVELDKSSWLSPIRSNVSKLTPSFVLGF